MEKFVRAFAPPKCGLCNFHKAVSIPVEELPQSLERRATRVRYAWLVVALLWFVAMLNYLDRLMITTMRDSIKADIAMTDAQFGLLTSAFLWVYAVVSPLGGFLADRFGRSTMICGSLIAWSAMMLWMGHVSSFRELFILRALMGLSEAFYMPAGLALIADYHVGRTRSFATGLHMTGIYSGAALGGIGGYLAEASGWRSGFNILGAAGIGYAVLLLFLLRDVRKSRAEVTAEVQPALKVTTALGVLFHEPGFWLLLALNALVGVANWGIYGWLPTYLRENFQLGLGVAGMSATGYIQVASFGGVLVGGAWADRWARTNPSAPALVPAIGYCIVAPCLFVASSTSVLAIAILGLAVFGLGRGFFDSNHMPMLRRVADQRYSATGFGFLNLISCASGGIMVYAGGAMKDAHGDLAWIFQVSAGGLLLVGLFLFAIARRLKRPLIS